MRRWTGLLVTLCAAAVAAAQDRDPFEAVLQAERVREKQAAQMKRAEDRLVNPMMGNPLPPTRHLGNASTSGTPVEIPREFGEGEASAPWLLPVVAVGAVVAVVAWRRSRRARWSKLPGHQGLHRK